MKKNNYCKNIGNHTLRLKKKEFIFRQKVMLFFLLPTKQKINVSHPPTIYLIETVLESIRFVSAVQLSDINCH